MDEVLEFFKKVNVYYLATVEGNQPRVRPFGTVNVFEGKLYIQTGLSKPVAQQLLANPKAEISGFDGEQWVRLSGNLILDERAEAQESMLAAYPSLAGMYAVGDGNTAVFYFENGVATITAFGGEPRVLEL